MFWGERLPAIVVGVAIWFALEKELGWQWYVALPLSAAGYLIVRFIIQRLAMRRDAG